MGQWTATKPSRSDEVLDAVEQNRIANLVRAQFDSIAPMRPTKPNRSESDSPPPPPTPPPCQNIPLPEFQKFQSLQSQAIFSGSFTSQDEFVETQYYKQLDSVDKQHHKQTGSGFINVDRERGMDGYDLKLQNGHENGGRVEEVMMFKTNLATNDWIPNIEDHQCSMCPLRSRIGARVVRSEERERRQL
ncbi:hypothetical protein LOK49_LG04G00893 [Camellia lanceoleosa]|uniref:Uncharacterized protein n=1 Tax=Camellia lanceoleosa TaxID=1840588 RepID=A0ACC0I6G9_9ERIC|nr:hypothetical protein LOK49_LG04G00893 [Camellia lanceoleosa]